MKQFVLDVGSHSLKMYGIADTAATLIDTLTWHVLEETNQFDLVHRSLRSILKKTPENSLIKAIGTEALRRKPHLRKIAFEVFSSCGIPLKVITQDEEAQLIRKAFLKMHRNLDLDVVNVGGGSIQIIHRDNRMTLLDFGISDLNIKFSLNQSPQSRRIAECIEWIGSRLPADLHEFAYTGGELTYLNRLNIETYDSWCKRSSFESMATRLALLDTEGLESLSPHDPKWMRGSIASNCIVIGLLNKSLTNQFYASDLNITNGFLGNFEEIEC